MPFELLLAIRYLRSRRKRRLARATALAAIGGIAVGIAALIVALALANGFRDEMRDKILRGTAHLTVMRSDGQPMSNYNDIVKTILTIPGIESASGTTYDGAVISGSKGSAYSILRGVDRQSPAGTSEIRNWITEGSLDPLFMSAGENQLSLPSIILGAELAARTGLHVGDTAEIFPTSSGSTSRRQARVAAIFRSGLFEYDSAWVYLSLDTAASFTGNSHAASLISVQVIDVDNVKNISGSVRNALGTSYTTVDWQETNRPLFTALALERRMGIFIVGLIVLVAMLNITTMLILVVVERRRDIAILNAMGAAKSSITALFMIEGAMIGTFGALAGVILGIAACYIGNRYKLVSLPADVYSISSVPFNVHAVEIALALMISFALSVLSTIYPARAAARMRPAETLRDAG